MSSTTADRLLVVGAGTMGVQIAMQAALHGVAVELYDIEAAALERAQTEIERLSELRVARQLSTTGETQQACDRLNLSSDLGRAAAVCNWAIEAVVERLDVKRAVFAELDSALPPGAGIATNSSSILSSRLANSTRRPGRCVNMHFFHPVVVMDLCEIAGGSHTQRTTVDEAVAWAKRMHRRPVVLVRETNGLVVNRILGSASREAFNLVAGGVAEPADIDVAVRHGLRWPLGPFELADLSGLDVVLESRRERHRREPDTANEPTIAVLERLVDAGRLGRKSGAGFYDYTTDPPAPLPLEHPRGR